MVVVVVVVLLLLLVLLLLVLLLPLLLGFGLGSWRVLRSGCVSGHPGCFGLIMVVWRLGDMVAPLGKQPKPTTQTQPTSQPPRFLCAISNKLLHGSDRLLA